MNNKIEYRWRCPRCGELMVVTSDISSHCFNCGTILYRESRYPISKSVAYGNVGNERTKGYIAGIIDVE